MREGTEVGAYSCWGSRLSEGVTILGNQCWGKVRQGIRPKALAPPLELIGLIIAI